MTDQEEGCGNFIGPYPCCSIITGDAKVLAKEIPDESIDLIFCDPVYDRIEDYRWLAETATDILQPMGHLVAFFQTNLARQTANALYGGGMETIWILSIYQRGGPSRRVAIGHVKQNLAWLCLKQESPMWQHNLVDVLEDVTIPNLHKGHSWQKNSTAIVKWIGWLTTERKAVFDPFCGGGTVPAVCKMLGRHYLAFEILPDVAEKARERVCRTQPPLFVMQPEQATYITGDG